MSNATGEQPGAADTRLEVAARRTFLAAALTGLGVVGLHRAQESDVFWHLHQGRAVLRNLSRVVPEPTAFPELAREAKVAAWLWDVLAYLTHQAAGFGGLAWLTSLFAVLAGVAVIWMLRTFRPSAPAAAFVLVSGVALACLTSRARARPEVAALVMLPLFVSALHRFTRDARSRTRSAVVAVAVALVWAQLHGSFLLVLPIAGVMLGASLLDSFRNPRARTRLLSLGLALLVASLSSTSGMGILAFGTEHAAFDIKLHNMEMHPPVWGTFHPLRSVYGPLYALMAGLGAYAALVARRAVLAEIGLALIAVVIVSQSVRFLAPATVLTAPLALHGASAIAQRARGRLAAAVLAASCLLACGLFYRSLARAHRTIGPLGATGLAQHALPLSSAAYLSRLPAGTRAITGYDAGGSLGFFLDGHVRTFVDSRTMVLFDDVQFAIARDVFRDRAVLDRAAQRYQADVVVVPRRSPMCGNLTSPWFPVVVEPEWTTFTKLEGETASRLRAIAPCGSDFLLPRACERNAVDLASDLKRLRALRASPLLSFADATRRLRCDGDAAGAAQRLPARADAAGFVVQRDLTVGEIALRLGRGAEILDAVGSWAAQGNVAAWDLLQRALLKGEVDAAAVLPLARSAAVALDDGTPPPLRELLATLCIGAGDAHCARFHGLRAAIAGSQNGQALLGWLAERHPDPDVRADAAGWRQALAGARGGDPTTVAAGEPDAGTPDAATAHGATAGDEL